MHIFEHVCMNIDKRNLKAVFEDNVYIGSIELVILLN